MTPAGRVFTIATASDGLQNPSAAAFDPRPSRRTHLLITNSAYFKTQPNRIHIDDEILFDLKARLAGIRWPDEVDRAGWDYGTSLPYLRSLRDSWREEFAHGGDLGGGVAARLGQRHADAVVGVHVMNVYGSIADGDPSPTDAERDYLEQQRRWKSAEGGYRHLQATRPQTAA